MLLLESQVDEELDILRPVFESQSNHLYNGDVITQPSVFGWNPVYRGGGD